MVNKQLYQLIEYARRMPYFIKLEREDQVTLLRASWNELLIATVAWRSIEVNQNNYYCEGNIEKMNSKGDIRKTNCIFE